MHHAVSAALSVALFTLQPYSAPAETAHPATPSELVQRLGDDSCEAREEAARQLQRLGRAAVDALKGGLNSPDREVRARCRELLPLALRSDLDIDLDNFVSGQRDAKATPLPGWERFRDLAGADLAARNLFVRIFREDRAMLELLAKNPTGLAGQLLERVRKIQQKYQVPGPNRGMDAAFSSEVNGMLLAACLGTVDISNFNQVSYVFYIQAVRAEIAGNAGSRRLAGRFLASRANDLNMLPQAVNMANYLGLTDVIDSTLKPAVVKQLDDAAKSDDLNNLTQLAYLVGNLNLWDVAESRIRPLLRKHIDGLAKNADLNKMQQLASIAQVLHMPDLLETNLKPIACQRILAAADNIKDSNVFYQARYLAQVLNLNEVFEAAMRPAAIRLISEAADGAGDVNKFWTALHVAQNLNMQEAMEGLLRPAGRRLVLAALEQPGDWNRLNQAISMCRTLNIQDVLEDSVKPVFRKHAGELAGKTTDPNTLNQLYNIAQNLQAPEVIEDHIKPALRKYFVIAKDQPINQSFIYQGFYLARTLQLKEAVPYAVNVSGSKQANGYARGLAIFFVGEFGTKEQVAGLAPLLSDTTEVGTSQVNWTSLRSQVRDVVLATILTAHKENLADYGYPYFQMIQGVGLYQTSASCAGFANDAARDTAFKKYKDWQAKQKKG